MREGYTEFIEIEVGTATYIQSIEIGQNRGGWSVVRVKAWDSKTSRWQILFDGDADPDQFDWYKATNQYHKFVPMICQTTFLSSIVRIELDTFSIFDWNEIDYVKVVGATTPKHGVFAADVTTKTVRVGYVPDKDFNGEDAFQFKGCDCAFLPGHVSEATTVSIAVNAANDPPSADSMSVTSQCALGIADEITLQAYDVDSNRSNLTFAITLLPSNAALYDSAGRLITPEVIPASLLGPTVSVLVDYSGLADPPSGFNFTFVAIDDAGSSGAAASVVGTCLVTRCQPGMFFDMIDERACVDCPAGKFASHPGVRSICDECAAGGFAPNTGSVSCGSCANGQVALNPGSVSCVVCPAGASCDDTSTLIVNPGMWRAHSDVPSDKIYIYECPIYSACPGGNSSGDEQCSTGFAGPLCSECTDDHFPRWENGKQCLDCRERRNHFPTIGLAFGIGLVSVVGLVSNRGRIKSTAIFKLLHRMYQKRKVRLKIIFFTLQVIAEFAQVTSGMHDSKVYPEPANSVAGGLGLSNVDILKFIPLSCVHASIDYYDTLIIKTVSPILVLAVLWIIPFGQFVRGKPYAVIAQRAATYSLIWFDLIYVSVSTTIFQCFVCDFIGGEYLLRAQLTLPCDGSVRRRQHTIIASLAVLLYPIGKKQTLRRLCVCFPES